MTASCPNALVAISNRIAAGTRPNLRARLGRIAVSRSQVALGKVCPIAHLVSRFRDELRERGRAAVGVDDEPFPIVHDVEDRSGAQQLLGL